MVNIPEFAKLHQTIMMRWIKQFHEKFIHRLNMDSTKNLRATAWQIEVYLVEHGGYHDAEFIRTLQQSLEKIVQQQCKTNWTVKKASTSLKGRVRGVNQYANKNKNKILERKKKVPVPSRLSKQINDRLMQKPD